VNNMTNNTHYSRFQPADAIVIGGGPAGLNGALMLARSRRSVLVIDCGEPRNAPAEAIHGLLGRDGMPPQELLRIGREEVRGYGGEVMDGEVVSAGRDGELFAVTLADGTTLYARRLLVTTGLVDRLPDVAGLVERWGHDVIHCPYCHGWEVRDRAIGILHNGPASMHHAMLFRQLSDRIVYFTNGAELERDGLEELAARGIKAVDGVVAAVEEEEGVLTGLRLEDGRIEACEVVAVATKMEARAAFLEQLGLVPEEHPGGMGHHIAADGFGRTSVAGVWVAGNVTDLGAQVGGSAAGGALAGAQINADLVREETEHAVAACRRQGEPHLIGGRLA
jgi:thioredoxin reductase